MSLGTIFDLVIVGAGPAGVGAAIQSHLYRIDFMVVEKAEVGGRLRLARRVDNWLYTLGGKRSGLFMAQVMKKSLLAAGSKIVKQEIINICWNKDIFHLRDRCGRQYRSRAVILATGTRPKSWRVGFRRKAERYIFPDWRSIPQVNGRRVAVIGGGETAFDQACSLAEKGAEVHIVIRGSGPKAYANLVKEAFDLGVRILRNFEADTVWAEDDKVCLSDSRGRMICCQAIVPSIGWTPNRPEVRDAAKKRKGQGLYWAGDVVQSNHRQAAIAFGDGVRAAMSAWRYLNGGE